MKLNTSYQYDESLFCEGLFVINVKSPVFSYGKKGKYTSENNEDYRYGFNGKENDDEISNTQGTNYTAEFWQYDARLGRIWETDPIVAPWESSYAAFRNIQLY